MYCINYAINSGSYSKIAETLLPMTKRKGSGKVWEEHDRKFLVGGGGGKWCGTFEDYQAIRSLKWLDQVTFQLTKDLMIHLIFHLKKSQTFTCFGVCPKLSIILMIDFLLIGSSMRWKSERN